jgi:DNA-binding NarL/FixJ family response regulator
MTIRILIADDQPVFVLGLRSLLQGAGEGEFLVVGEASEGEALRDTLAATRPDLLLLDRSLPGQPRVDLLRELLAQGTRIVALLLADEEDVLTLLDAGVTGCVLKNEAPELIVQALRAVAAGDTWLSPRIAGRVLRAGRAAENAGESEEPAITPRESHILRLVAQGKSNSDIADELVLSKATVQNHISNIYAKLKLQNRSQAMIYALRHNLVRVDEIVG